MDFLSKGKQEKENRSLPQTPQIKESKAKTH